MSWLALTGHILPHDHGLTIDVFALDEPTKMLLRVLSISLTASKVTVRLLHPTLSL